MSGDNETTSGRALGATNADSGNRGLSRNVLTGEPTRPVAANARHYRSRGPRSIIVAAQTVARAAAASKLSSPHVRRATRRGSSAAVAGIHESNPKILELLALVPSTGEDYDRLR